jgi:hypothetical protein
VRPVCNVFYKLSCTEQRREGVAAYLWVCDRSESKKYNNRAIPNKLWGQALEIQRGFVADITYWYIYSSRYILLLVYIYHVVPRRSPVATILVPNLVSQAG